MNNINKLKINRTILKNRFLTYILVPAITISGSYMIGKERSNKIDEYMTITRIFEGSSGRILNKNEEYIETETNRVITVLECSPWNLEGNHFKREVNAYEVDLDYFLKNDYLVNNYNISDNMMKYTYVERKNDLDEDENTIDSMIYVVETYQDKNNSRKSTKYIVPCCVTGIVLSMVLDFILFYTKALDSYKINDYLDVLDREIENNKVLKK